MSVTLVTCYYKVISKYDFTNYDKWINNLLQNINCNIIIFTSNNLVDYFNKLYPDKTKLTIICKELENLPINKKYNTEFWDKQKKIDPDKKCKRTQFCYQIWNSKFYFLKLAIKINPYNSDKFIWNDIGSMRDLNYTSKLFNYPQYDKISNDKLDIILIKKFDNDNQFFFQNEIHLSASIFGGSKDIILELHTLYYKYFEQYIEKKLFIGCDQQILSTTFVNNKDKFNIIIPNNNIIDKWFWLYFYYTN